MCSTNIVVKGGVASHTEQVERKQCTALRGVLTVVVQGKVCKTHGAKVKRCVLLGVPIMPRRVEWLAK